MVIEPNLSRDKTPMVMTASLSLVRKSHTLRADAKQGERRFAEFEAFISSVDAFCLSDFLPEPFVRGAQPQYIETLEPVGVPVISTMAIQDLSIRTELCRYITQDDYDSLHEAPKARKNDVLLTMDGGPSIGKPVFFDLDGDYAIDSHVAILRPVGIDPRLLVYLLASPLGHVQFQQAESGASGQTGVTEEDVRRFRFPVLADAAIDALLHEFAQARAEIAQLVEGLRRKEEEAWAAFNQAIVARAKPR